MNTFTLPLVTHHQREPHSYLSSIQSRDTGGR
ncbi:hypothetical protein FHX37_2619 [Haloactinospora alba]|uniref:Uncharacterized protein n=1 Tax=Haloactinospora alba TaxID=405555 RepID=A0A543NLF1_9ACTN|nr:hypothetical protein FHX37_2619 [Haloactinospora alba]